MPDIVIRSENISKRYRIGLKEEQHDTFVGAAIASISRPFQNLRRLRHLTAFSDGTAESDDVIWALKNISFDVRQGEVLGIIGRNGAGKSTLLKILSRITHPTTGYIEMHGRFSSLLEVGTGFHPELTGRENVYLNGTILGMRKVEIDRKFDEIVNFSGVEKFIDTPVKRYSSGMRVRLAFSVAAYLEPEILLIDEVLAVGDTNFQKKCLGKMEDVARQGRTVLFVSHNMAAVQGLCSRAILLENGRIDYVGDIQETIEHYLGKDIDQFTGVDLTTHPGRRAGSKLVIRNLRIFDNESETYYLSVGHSIGFEILLDPASESYENVTIGFGIYSLLGQLVFACKTNIQYPGSWNLDQEKLVKLLWDECLLAPGLYKIGISFSDEAGVIDWVDDIVEIEVRIEKDFYGTGKSGLQKRGIIFPKVKWEI